MANNRQARNNDPYTGIIYMTAPDNDRGNAPIAKGFVGVSKAMLRVLLEQEEDNYGSVKIEVAVWAKEDSPGVLSGKAQLPYAIRKQMQEGSYQPPVSASQPTTKAVVAEVVVDAEDIPF